MPRKASSTTSIVAPRWADVNNWIISHGGRSKIFPEPPKEPLDLDQIETDLRYQHHQCEVSVASAQTKAKELARLLYRFADTNPAFQAAITEMQDLVTGIGGHCEEFAFQIEPLKEMADEIKPHAEWSRNQH